MWYYMSHLWKKVQYEILDLKKKQLRKKHDFIWFPVKYIKISDIFLQNPKVPRNVIGFSNRFHRFTVSNYLVVDSSLGHFSVDQYFL